ncbi:hypothetical protein D3C81_1722130 [compost metagenome]
MDTPAAWNFGERICTKFHTEGMDRGRWVSLARMLRPLRLFCGAMAQLLEAATPSMLSAAICPAALSTAARPGICPPSCRPLSFSASSKGSGSSG